MANILSTIGIVKVYFCIKRRGERTILKMLRPVALNLFLMVLSLILGVNFYLVPEVPELDFDRWWGEGEKPINEDKAIRQFNIMFNDSMVNDLKARLYNRRPFTRPMDGIQSQYGINSNYLDTVLNYWMTTYNFEGRAARLDAFPHFKTRIQGLDIHFIRVKPQTEGVKVFPLLLVHGWPSSSKEFDMAIPMLTKPRSNYDFVFEIVAVDLPGFGFSEGTNKPGLNPVQIAIIIRNLMHRLGFSKFYVQAGDWGSQVSTHMSTLFPDEILGFHTNMPLSTRPISLAKQFILALVPSLFVEEKYVQRVSLKHLTTLVIREMGYYHLQATKPDTIGAGLSDSPAGMAAYILEKIGAGFNRDQLDTPHGGLENIDRDDLLDTLTIMWANEHITTSMRLYAEAYAWGEVNVVQSIPTNVPTAAISFKYEIIYQPDWILQDKFRNLVRSTTLDFGGHFAAMHTPKALVDDVFAAVEQFMNFHSEKDIE